MNYKPFIDEWVDELNRETHGKMGRAQQDFVGCLLTGLLSAMPCFLEAFLTCLGGGASPGGYTPGDRKRCGD